jgi:flagellar assembly protein FliH
MAEIFRDLRLSEDLFHLEQINKKPENKPLSKIEDSELLGEKAGEAGYKSGFSQGMTEGIKQGKEQAGKENAELAQQLKNLLQTIPQALSESRLALQTDIADIVLAISQQFFVSEQQNKEAIAQQISAALNHVNDKQDLTLVLNPQDLALLQQGELKIDFSHCQDLRIVADASLALGGCLIRCEHGVFDAGIERQIERLKQVLLEIKGQNNYG